MDEKEVAWIASRHPNAAAELDQGEALLAAAPPAANVEKAADLFRRAAEEEPASGLLFRRQCQALSALGRHREAVSACNKSLARDYRSPFGMRAMVAALMSGPNPPTERELAEAMLHAHRASEVLAAEPVGFAGQCDIAEKLGDVEMLNGCIKNLERVAPEHYETLRAKAIAASLRPGWRVTLGWLALAILCVTTAVHALLRRPWRRTAPSIATALVALAVLVRAPSARAADNGGETPQAAPAASADDPEGARTPVAGHLSKFPIDDKDPASSVPTAEQRDHDPLEYGYFIMDLGDRAQWAIDKGDHLAAAAFYRALVKAVPDASVGFVKTCEQYEQGGDKEKATEYCAAALTRPGATVADYSHYARLVLQKKDLKPADLANVDNVIKHLEKDESSRTVGLDIECTLGAREGDRARLEHCVPFLTAVDSKSQKTLFYQWALAIQRKDIGAAERILDRTRAWTQTPAPQIAQMERVTREAAPAWRKMLRPLGDWRAIASFALVSAVALSALALRRRPLRRADA